MCMGVQVYNVGSVLGVCGGIHAHGYACVCMDMYVHMSACGGVLSACVGDACTCVYMNMYVSILHVGVCLRGMQHTHVNVCVDGHVCMWGGAWYMWVGVHACVHVCVCVHSYM